MPPREWCEAKTQFANMFDERFVTANPGPAHKSLTPTAHIVLTIACIFQRTRTMTICAILQNYSPILVMA